MNAKLSHFSELSNFLSEKSSICNDFLSLLDRFKLGQSLRKLKMEKEKGAPALDFNQERYFILDDTMIEKSGISMEGISRVYDHVAQKCALGYKLLLLAITDTKSTLPLEFSLHAEAGRKKDFGLTKKQLKDRFTKKRSNDDCMKKRADELLKEKPDIAIEMLRRAVKNGYVAKYFLFDKWFFGEDFIKKVRSIKDGAIHVITLLRNKTTGFMVNGKRISAKVLIQKQERIGFKTCRQYKSHYARIKAEYNGIPVQLFIIRYGRSSKYEVMVTTDMKLSFKDAFERYQIRWNIEVLFYECKQHLELGRCQSTDLNAQIADCTLAFIGYTVISLHKRFSDYKTFGELFRDIKEGLLELTFIERLLPIIAELLEKIASLFDSTLDDLLERAMADEETRQDLERILRCDQDFKKQPMD